MEDLMGLILARGLTLPDPTETIRSITGVRDRAVIVTDRYVYLVRPDHRVDFSITRLGPI